MFRRVRTSLDDTEFGRLLGQWRIAGGGGSNGSIQIVPPSGTVPAGFVALGLAGAGTTSSSGTADSEALIASYLSDCLDASIRDAGEGPGLDDTQLFNAPTTDEDAAAQIVTAVIRLSDEYGGKLRTSNGCRPRASGPRGGAPRHHRTGVRRASTTATPCATARASPTTLSLPRWTASDRWEPGIGRPCARSSPRSTARPSGFVRRLSDDRARRRQMGSARRRRPESVPDVRAEAPGDRPATRSQRHQWPWDPTSSSVSGSISSTRGSCPTRSGTGSGCRISTSRRGTAMMSSTWTAGARWLAETRGSTTSVPGPSGRGVDPREPRPRAQPRRRRADAQRLPGSRRPRLGWSRSSTGTTDARRRRRRGRRQACRSAR